MRKAVLLATLVTAMLLSGNATGCAGQPASTLDVAATRAYADAATETALQGLSDGDLEK